MRAISRVCTDNFLFESGYFKRGRSVWSCSYWGDRGHSFEEEEMDPGGKPHELGGSEYKKAYFMGISPFWAKRRVTGV